MDPVYFEQIVDRIINLLLVLGIFGVSLLIGLSFFYLFIIYIRLKKREAMSLGMVTMEVKISKDNEIKIDAAEQMLAGFTTLKSAKFWSLGDIDEVVALEIIGKKADIRFYVTVPEKIKDMTEKQIYGFYPQAEIVTVEEPNVFSEKGKVAFAALKQKDVAYQPFKTYRELPTDPLANLTTTLSKMNENEGAVIQILMRNSKSKWKKAGKSYISSIKKKESTPDKATFKVDSKILEKIDDKCSKSGFDSVIRIVVSSDSKESANQHLRNIKGSFSQFTSDLNSLTNAKIFSKKLFMIDFIYKLFPIIEIPFFRNVSVLSVDELATLFHFPNKTIETPYINWLKAKSAPVAAEVPSDGGTFIGYGYHRGVRRPVHIGNEDRRRHVYIIGKTGVGKSELLLDMAVQDIKSGRGVCVIDPHGDLIEDILRFIPPERAEDVVYFDPADSDRPMGLNLLEAKTEDQKHFITTAIINLMYKLYDPQRTGIIGPRFEHAVRNAMLTVMCDEGATFVEVVRALTDMNYVQDILPKVEDHIVRRYWTDQIAQTSDFHKSETLDYIVSKFGRFVTNRMMRNIIGQSKSAFDFRDVMDNEKILLINLSKGRLGEENSNFLGLVLIPKILLAAMSRQDMPQEKRKDFYLYVDEFQNFATPDFATILSEARKYRLNLTVANQFIGQMDEEVKNAIFGNVGTKMVFRVGVTDSSYLAHEFQPVFSDSDLINIERYHVYMKTIVDNDPVPPFSVDLSKDIKAFKAQASDKVAEAVIQLSRLKYGRPRELVDAEIVQRAKL